MTSRTGAVWLLVLVGAAACRVPAERESDEPALEADPQAQTPVVAVRAPPAEPSEGFAHRPHGEVTCVTCHVTVPSHSTHADYGCRYCHTELPDPERRVTETDCLACHHDRTLGMACGDCHLPAEVVPGMVATPLRVATWEAPRSRRLPFDHQGHVAKSCDDCHDASAQRSVATACRDCHEDHHTSASPCLDCHGTITEDVHVEFPHTGCGGSGCHVDPIVNALPPTRAVCLACHDDQLTHEPERACAECHAMPPRWRAASGAGR